MAVERDIIQKSGAWFSYKDLRIAQGRDNARKYLVDNREIANEIEAAIRLTLQPDSVKTEGENDGDTGSDD